MASEIRVDKINSLSGVGTVTLSPTGVDIAGITTAATLRATTGIVTTFEATTGNITTLRAPTGIVTTFEATTGNITTLRTPTGISTHFTADKISLPDSSDGSINIGIGSDLIIYHDGNNSFIKNSTGNLRIQDTNGNIQIQAKAGEDSIIAKTDGEVELYHDATKRFATTGNGADVFGNGASNNYFKLINTSGTSNASHHMTIDTFNAANSYWNDLKIDASNIQLNTYTGNRATLSNTALTFASGVNIAMASGNGINFAATADGGGTMSNELLDDYEEGSFTFVRKGHAGGFDSNYQLANQTGKYTKIGRQVLLKGGFSLTGNSGNIAASDYFTITVGSLPFAPDDTSSGHTGAQIYHQGTWWAYTSLGGGSNAKGSVIEVSGDYLSFYCTSVTGSPVRNSNEITFTISYTST